MGRLSRRLVFGREANRRHRWKRFVGGYAAVVAAFFAVVFVLRAVGAEELSAGLYRAFPVLLFYSPAIVSAVATFRGGGLLLSLAVGTTPVAVVGVVFGAIDLAAWFRGAVPPGDAPAWALVLAYAVVTLTAAVVGFVAGTTARLAAEHVGRTE